MNGLEAKISHKPKRVLERLVLIAHANTLPSNLQALALITLKYNHVHVHHQPQTHDTQNLNFNHIMGHNAYLAFHNLNIPTATPTPLMLPKPAENMQSLLANYRPMLPAQTLNHVYIDKPHTSLTLRGAQQN